MSVIEPTWITLRDGTKIHARSPSVDDIPALLRYLDRMRRETEGVLWSPQDDLPTPDDERKWVEKQAQNPGDVHVTAWVNDELASMAGIESGRRARTRHSGVLGLSVMQAWHHRGVGTAMMRLLLDWARRHPSLELVKLEVFTDNPWAIHLYERCGFTRDGVSPRHAKRGPGRYADVMHMSLWLGEKQS
ncbi:MAG: GNAT family N-acetyltransferase [Phycisphaeraceae bacterium]|nr:GNAT family N-acetyltransferase [Phycisphaeraceae bacterium]